MSSLRLSRLIDDVGLDEFGGATLALLFVVRLGVAGGNARLLLVGLAAEDDLDVLHLDDIKVKQDGEKADKTKKASHDVLDGLNVVRDFFHVFTVFG